MPVEFVASRGCRHVAPTRNLLVDVRELLVAAILLIIDVIVTARAAHHLQILRVCRPRFLPSLAVVAPQSGRT